jgi:uncharacterized protein YndB with AHSA1/START domain
MSIETTDSRELVFQRHIAAPRHAVWRAWTEPDLLAQWFCPAPWTVAEAILDPRPGGAHSVTMRSPEGELHPGPGVYLEVVPEERIVFTDAYTAGWVPGDKPFMTGIVTFEDDGDGTLYTARVRHWSDEDRAKHDEMGFQDGWGAAAQQLEDLARGL